MALPWKRDQLIFQFFQLDRITNHSIKPVQIAITICEDFRAIKANLRLWSQGNGDETPNTSEAFGDEQSDAKLDPMKKFATPISPCFSNRKVKRTTLTSSLPKRS